ncbi:response regulator [Endozoicomonas sp. Mp262]|uniref:response regulator n=1 Tax=Endozoicomonas sp. Mp262 TaxID=2919499 RepID=UPI0021D7D48A
MPHFKSSSQSLSHKFVLIADSDIPHRAIVEKILLKAKLETVSVSHGQEALGLYEGDPDRWGAILMSCELPVMDGYTAACSIRQFERNNHLAPVNIIGMSNGVSCDFASKALRAGMNDYLAVPFDPQQLLGTLSRYIAIPGATIS